MSVAAHASPVPLGSGADVTPLTWVQEEVRRALEGVHKTLRRQLREFELRQAGGQLDAALTTSALQAQAQQLHQVAGVLKLVNRPEGQRLMLAAEALLQRCGSEASLRAEQVDAVERAGFALLTYMSRLVGGSSPSPLALFPAYRRLQELNQAERIHPADFSAHHFEWRTLPPPQLLDQALPTVEALRSAFENALLRQMRDTGPTHAAHLAELCAGIGLALGAEPQQSFWQLAAAHFEAQAQGMLASDTLVKRMASRLLAQLRAHLNGGHEVNDRLVQDLLFFCAQSGEPRPGQAPRLRAVRVAYGLDEAEVGDYQDDSLGRIDPAWVQQALRRVGAAKDAWSAVADGDQARAAVLDEASSQLTESLAQLFQGGEHLGQTLQRAAVVTLRAGTRPPAALAMEVASALLYLEAALEDGEYDQAGQRGRVERLAQRVQAAATGQPVETLESWMEDLFRRVADRQTLGSVVQELRVNLGEVERATDEYFRDPTKRQALIPVPGQLQAMRGVFTVLGVDDAAVTCVRMRDEIDRLSNTEVDPSLSGPQAVFQRLATNLGQLGFLIDMLSVQAPLAKEMFRFDEERGELVATVERERRPRRTETSPQAAAATPPPAPAVPEIAALAPPPTSPPAPLALSLADFDLPDLDLPEVAAPASAPAPEVIESAEALLDLSMLDEPVAVEPVLPPASAVDAAPSPAAPPAVADEGEIDAEMLEIFLEEAGEVLGNAQGALERLRETPADRPALTDLRRAFHTLKGSGRMVGLNRFGEAAWACEQLCNARLSDERPADTALLSFAAEAALELGTWRDAIAAGDATSFSPTGIRERADQLRLGLAPAPTTPAETPEVLEAATPADAWSVQAPSENGPDTLIEAGPDTVIDVGAELVIHEELPSEAPVESAELAAAEDTLVPIEEEALLSLDLAALEALDAPVEVAPTAVVQEPALELDFDLPDAGFEATQTLAVPVIEPEPLPVDLALDLVHLDAELSMEPEPAALEEPIPLDLGLPEPTAVVPPEELPALDLRLDLGEPEPLLAEEPSEIPEAPEQETLEVVSSSAIDDAAEVPALDVAATRPVELSLPEEPSPALPETSAEEEPAEARVQIGDLSISEALFNIFAAEADEQSQRLLTSLQDWALAHDTAPPSASEVYAHALAGNAATVGHASLSQLARALEHALGRAQQAWRVGEADTHHFVQAARAIRALLQGFNEGRLEGADAALIEGLQGYQPELPPEDSAVGGLDGQDVALAPDHATPTPAAPLDDVEFPLGQADAIDLELWDIFEEEAGDLLHQLHGRLRDWARHPSDTSRGDACMRTLHTFKGGARLAGAMQLGELAHRLEADVLALLAQGQRSVAEVAPLQDRGDELEARFEQLRQLQHATPAPADIVPQEPAAAELEPGEPADQADQPVQLEAPVAPEPALPFVERAPLVLRDPSEVPWGRFAGEAARELTEADAAPLVSGQAVVRVRAALLDRLAAQSGEVSIRRARMENELTQMKTALTELDDNLERLRTQLRELELQAEAQISSRQEAARAQGSDFDPLEFDRYTRFQEVTRMLAESVNDVATVQRSLQRNVSAGEDELAAQARLTRELQDDLLASRMVEFESLSERLHRVVRQAARESGKQVQLDIAGHGIELDRGVLERLIGAFEHLLRNAVAHGIETPEQRRAAGKPEMGQVRISLTQEGNQVLISFQDDGAGLNLARIREKALAQGLLKPDQSASDAELSQLIFAPGFSTATQVSEIAGRGVGMDVVRAEVTTLGGYVLTRSQAGKGTEFDLRVPLTTALTQVVLLRVGELQVAVPASLVDSVLRLPNADLSKAYESGLLKAGLGVQAVEVPIYWLGGLLAHSDHPQLHGKHAAVVLVHSGTERIAIHVDEVVGNQEVVIKNLGPQLIHVPGLAGISLLASGNVALIYNLVALAERYGASALARAKAGGVAVIAPVAEQQVLAPLVMVVDDSLTVRRVSQRFLEREGYRVQLAKDGLDAMEQLAREDLPDMVLSDIEMPRMDGFDLVRNIRADARLRDLPVVMITSRIAEKHRDYAAQLGVQGYLGKPYDEETLLRLIRQHTALGVAG
ncbi:MAG: Hpt domain-containing protein [Burkholderiales bacterium]|nr:Hpt domain-containing protein [Burkholderiales bacterium]